MLNYHPAHILSLPSSLKKNFLISKLVLAHITPQKTVNTMVQFNLKPLNTDQTYLHDTETTPKVISRASVHHCPFQATVETWWLNMWIGGSGPNRTYTSLSN